MYQQYTSMFQPTEPKRSAEDAEDNNGNSVKKPRLDVDLVQKYKNEFPKGTPLVCACEKGRVEDVNTFINAARAAGMDVTAMVNEGGKDSIGHSRTPLMMAAEYEHSTIIEILLQCNADTATTDYNGYNALHLAAWFNKTTTTTVQLLLNNMKLEDINHINRYGYTPLEECYDNDSSIQQQIIDLMRSKGAKRAIELNADALVQKYKNEFPKGTPLVVACEKGRVEDVNTFINAARAAGRNVTAMVNELGTVSGGASYTPLMIAAWDEHSTIIKILLQCNADPAITDNHGFNALHYAADNNNTTTTIVQLLLNNMKLEDINHKNKKDGNTPLDDCYKHNVSSIKQQLIDLIRQKGGKRKSELAAEAEIKRISLLPEKELKELYKTLNEKYKKEFPKGTPLVVACEKGRVEDVEGMIRGARAAGRNVTAMVSEVGTSSSGYSRTPLMIAAMYEHSTIIEILLQYNVNTATTNEHGKNALHIAARYNDTTTTTTTTVQLLLNNMTLEDINHKERFGRTPLDYCYEYNNSSIKQQIIDLMRSKGAKRAIELKADALVQKYKNEFPEGTPLVVACGAGRVEDVKTFTNAGMDVNEFGKDSNGFSRTPLMTAALYEHFQVVNYLIKQDKADTYIATSHGENALHYAARLNKKNTDIVELLLTHMTLESINNKSGGGWTPLDWAYGRNDSPIKQQIIDLMRSKGALRGKEVDLVEKYEKEFRKGTPLVVACEKGSVEDVKTFINAGMDVNEVGKDSVGHSRTPLIAAVEYEHTTIVSYLLTRPDINPATTDNYGQNALHYAAANNKTTTTTVQLLLNNMKLEDINHINTLGYTPLDVCYNNNYSSIQQQLIALMRSKGALRGKEVDLVHTKGYVSVYPNLSVEELKEKYRQEFRYGIAVTRACEKGRLEDVKKLITKENVNEEDRFAGQSRTPLMAAVEKEQVEIVTYLLEYGADANVLNQEDENALHVAIGTENRKILQLLLLHMTLEAITHRNQAEGLTPLELAANYEHDIASALIQSKIYELTPGAVLGHCYTLEEFRNIKMPEQQLIMNKSKEEDFNDPTAKKIYPVKVKLMEKCLLATGDESGKNTIYDVNTKATIHQWDHDGYVLSVCFSPDGSMLATGDDEDKTTIYDLKSKTKINQFDHQGAVFSVCFSPDGSMLATGDDANKTTIYDLKSKTKIHEWDHNLGVRSVCFSPDGSMLATGDDAKKTTIYDVNTKAQIHQWSHDNRVNSVCFSPIQYSITWDSYNNGESLYVYNAQELKRWLNTNKLHYQSKHNKTPLTNRLIYGVQFLTQEEINQQEAISQNTQGTPEKRLRDMIDEIQKIDAKISNSSSNIVINALTSKREGLVEEFVKLYNREKNNRNLLLKLQTDYPFFISHIFEDSSDDSDDDSSDDESEADDERKMDDMMHHIQIRF